MRHGGLTIAVALLPVVRAAAQVPQAPPNRPPTDSTVVELAAGPQYAEGWLKRFLLRADYRTAWTTPISVPVLNLATFAGGLTPVSAGGGLQTKSLWLRGADGYQYAFRSVDKHASSIPEEMWGTLLEDLALDQNSSLYPGAPIAVTQLAHAAGVPEPEQTRVFLPNDPRLGEFRERFKNTLGTFARRANRRSQGQILRLDAGRSQIVGRYAQGVSQQGIHVDRGVGQAEEDARRGAEGRPCLDPAPVSQGHSPPTTFRRV